MCNYILNKFERPKTSFSFPQKSEVPSDYDKHDPEQKQIYRFVRTLFSAAQLTAECAIVTLVSERSCDFMADQ